VSFSIGKILWILLNPGNLCLFLVVAGLGARRGLRRGLAIFGTLGLVAIAVLPLSSQLAQPLEDRFPANPALPEHIDGIIVLGGAIEPELSRERGQIILNGAAERMTEAMALARLHGEARVLFSGGEGRLLPSGAAEAESAATFFQAQGLGRERLLLEGESRNTYENAVFSYALARPVPPENWVLVTSAMHMPRAVGCFRHAGWRVIPYPVDYRTRPRFALPRFVLDIDFNLAEGLAVVVPALKEWVGLAAYRLLGHSDTLFPG